MQNYKTIENGLIPVMENEKGEKLVNARLLHEFLEIDTKFSDWIKERIVKYELVKNVDFTSFTEKSEKPQGGRPTTEYILTLDIAKELSMVESNKKGSDARKYFINIEKKYKQDKIDSIDKLKLEQQGLKFALEILNPSEGSKIKMLRDFNKTQGLSTEYLPIYADEEAGLSPTQLLKEFDIKLSAVKFNQLLLEQGYLMEQERKSSKGTKKYKVLTERGKVYGKNDTNTFGSSKESQPLYYKNKFQELINSLVFEGGRN